MNLRKHSVLILAGALGVIASAVYFATLSVGPYPILSATLLERAAQITPAGFTEQPIWRGLVLLVGAVGLPLSATLNAINAVLGGLCVALIAYVAAVGMTLALEAPLRSTRHGQLAVGLSAVIAGLCLAFAPPFWIAATRAHPAPLATLLVLLNLVSLLRFLSTGSLRCVYVLSFLVALTCVELATMYLIGTMIAVVVVYRLWVAGQLDLGLVLRALLLAAVGFSLHLAAAYHFTLTAAFDFHDLTSVREVLWKGLVSQYLVLTRSLSRSGWLLVVASTTVPFAMSVLSAKRALGGERDVGLTLLHIVLLGVTCAVLRGAPFAPWSLMGIRPLMVTPYVLCALTAGYLVAYCVVKPLAWAQSRESRLARPLAIICATGLSLGLLWVSVGTAFENASVASARASRTSTAYADAILDAVGTREWLVSDGSLDAVLAVRAQERGLPLKLLNVNGSRNEMYMRYVAAMIGDENLASLAPAGMTALLQEWLQTDPGIHESMAIMSAPDLWLGSGRSLVPSRSVFNAVSETSTDSEQWMGDHRAFWAEHVPRLRRVADSDSELNVLCSYHLRHTSLVANNLGVMLENFGRQDEAYEAYDAALEAFPDNLSALLNQQLMLGRGYRDGDASAVIARIEEILGDGARRVSIWALARNMGYVRKPEAFLALGWSWALSGHPSLAISGMKSAVKMSGGTDIAADEGVAHLKLTRNELSESERLFLSILDREPQNVKALLGLARIASRQGDFQVAKGFLERAEAAGFPKMRAALEWAITLTRAGEYARARVVLEDYVELDPDSPVGWALLADVFSRMDERRELNRCLQKLRGLSEKDYLGEIVLGNVGLRDGNLRQARIHFETAHRLRPASKAILVKLINLDIREAKPSDAELHVGRLLRLDAGNAFGNWILGSLYIESGELSLAEAVLRKSLIRARTPAALSDLAWVLAESEEYAEAEALARETIKMEANMYSAWGNLGRILTQTARYDEAEKVLLNGVALAPQNFRVRVHLAELYAISGRFDEAEKILSDIRGSRVRTGAVYDERIKAASDLIRKGRAKAGE